MPEEYLGDIMGDITSRRGRVEGMEARGNAQVVSAQVPLSEMFGYATSLRSSTQGRGTYSWYLTTTKMYLSQYKKKSLRKTKGEE